MKQIVCLVSALTVVVFLKAQTPLLCLSTSKTTSLIFPFPIKHVDRGSQDVIVQQVAGAENILLVKAAVAGISETNLSVVTGDGSLYSFAVCYDPSPADWVYKLPAQKEAAMMTYANAVLVSRPLIKSLHQTRGKVEMRLTGIYVREEVLYYQLILQNKSPLDYSVGCLRFSIKDKHVAKRTAVQEVEQRPLLVAGNASIVKAQETTTIVVALEKHVVTKGKTLVIDLTEKGEGRNFSLVVPGRFILHAAPLPVLKQ